MTRYASHYLYLPSYGFLKHHLVEVEGGVVTRLLPFSGEVEDTQWLPGIIVLHADDGLLSSASFPPAYFQVDTVLTHLPDEFELWPTPCYLYWLTPFDFLTWQPVGETRCRQLR